MKKQIAKHFATKRKAPAVHGRQVRIIGGTWKRTPLPVLDADGLRPTPDRVRETLFNWLNHLLDGNWGHVACLDLFAGTGALGFEAASRGAARVLMVESNTPAMRQLEATRDKLQAQDIAIVRGDAFSMAQNLAARVSPNGVNDRFDLIFLDPPYHQDWLPKMLPLCVRLLTANGLVYAEAEHLLDEGGSLEWLKDWDVIRSDQAGMVFYHLLRCKSTA